MSQQFYLDEYPLWTALVTPMDDKGEVHYDDLLKLLKEQEEARNGILILGSTGEALNLREEEKKEIISFTLKQNLNAPIMVGVGGSEIYGTTEWVKYLNTLPIQATLMVTPLYAKPETEGQYEWFKTLMDASHHPVMLYNVPGRTGKALSFDVVKRLNQHPRFWAIKEASGSVEDFKKYNEAAGGKPVLSGDDGLLPAFSAHGCRGLVSVASNTWPKETHAYVVKSLEGTLSQEDASLWDACSAALFCVSNPIPAKRLLAEDGRISHPHLRLPLSHKDLSQAATVLEASTRIKDWYKNNS